MPTKNGGQSGPCHVKALNGTVRATGSCVTETFESENSTLTIAVMKCLGTVFGMGESPDVTGIRRVFDVVVRDLFDKTTPQSRGKSNCRGPCSFRSR